VKQLPVAHLSIALRHVANIVLFLLVIRKLLITLKHMDIMSYHCHDILIIVSLSMVSRICPVFFYFWFAQEDAQWGKKIKRRDDSSSGM